MFFCRKGISALHCAVANDHLDIIMLLLEAKADVNVAGDRYKRTPLFMASEMGNIEMAKVLIQYGAKLNLADKYGELDEIMLVDIIFGTYWRKDSDR